MTRFNTTTVERSSVGPRFGKGLLVGLVTVAALVTLGGPGYATWTAIGIGTGSVTDATNVAVTLSPATAGATLLPGGQAAVVLTVSNPNSSTARISALTLDTTQGSSGFSVDSGHSGCTVTSFTFTTQTNGGTGWTVPAKVGSVNGTLSITLANAVAMGVAAPNACQGATTTIFLAAS